CLGPVRAWSQFALIRLYIVEKINLNAKENIVYIRLKLSVNLNRIKRAQVCRAGSLDRDKILRASQSKDRLGHRQIFSTIFHPAIQKWVYDIFRQAQVILECDEEHKKLFPSIPLVSFRRSKTLRDFLVRSKLSSGFQTGSCTMCHDSRCQICDMLLESREFSNSDGSRTFSIRKGDFTCKSKFIIYRLLCGTCGKQYIGSSVCFRKRVNNYKSHFRSYCERKTAGTLDRGKAPPQGHLFSHFVQADHKGLDDFRFQIIDSSNTEVQLRERESFWQYKLKTFLPLGLNERKVPKEFS
ncbi:MAG: hypothetical protein AAFY76_20890, partial [Cyanobacteria bacterium J06649_11]